MKGRRLSDFRHFVDVDFAEFFVDEESDADQGTDLVNFDLALAWHSFQVDQVLRIEIYSHFALLEFQNCPNLERADA